MSHGISRIVLLSMVLSTYSLNKLCLSSVQRLLYLLSALAWTASPAPGLAKNKQPMELSG